MQEVVVHEVDELREKWSHQLFWSTCIFVNLKIKIRFLRKQRVAIAVQKVFKSGHVHTSHPDGWQRLQTWLQTLCWVGVSPLNLDKVCWKTVLPVVLLHHSLQYWGCHDQQGPFDLIHPDHYNSSLFLVLEKWIWHCLESSWQRLYHTPINSCVFANGLLHPFNSIPIKSNLDLRGSSECTYFLVDHTSV